MITFVFKRPNQNDMKRVTTIVLMLCLILSGAWSHAKGEARTEKENKEGIPIEVKEVASLSGLDKSNAILSFIDGHVLTVVFLENLGQVSIEISRVPTGETQIQSTHTPDGVEFYIFSTGNFIVTFTLPNGDEYYGEFSVTD